MDYAPCSKFKPTPHDEKIRLHKKSLKAFDTLPKTGIVDFGKSLANEYFPTKETLLPN